MPSPRLVMLSDWEVEETITLNVSETQLGDSYSQTTAAGILLDRTWTLRSWVTDSAKLDSTLAALKQFQGAQSFLWSPDDGDTVAVAPYFCEEWTVTPYGPNVWAIEGELMSDPSGECEIFRNDLDEATMLGQMAGAIAWLATYTRSTNPLIVNPQGVSCNSFHSVLGRGGYLPPSTGTTEGQAAIIRALLIAYKTPQLSATAKTQALSQANLMASALEPYFYGVNVPAVPTAQVWLPHWVINARGSFVSKGSQTPADFMNYGYFDIPVSFTAGVGVVPGGLLADLGKVYSVGGKLLWRNVTSPLISGTEYAVNYWVSNLQLGGVRYRFAPNYQTPGAPTPIATTETAGTVVLSTPFTGTLWLAYSAYDGTTIATNQRFDAFPMWRPLQAGEVNHAFDVSWWIDEAFELLAEVTGASKWGRAREANKFSTIATGTILNESFLLKTDTTTSDPFAYPGTGYTVVNNSAPSSAARAGDGGVIVTVGDGAEAYPSAELQNFAITVSVIPETIYRTQLACSVATLMEVVLSLAKNAGDFGQEYTAWVPVPATLSTYTQVDLLPQSFVRWFADTWWHSTSADNPTYQYSGGGGSATVALEMASIGGGQRLVTRINMNRGGGYVGVGFVLFGPTNQPPALHYRTTSAVRMRIQDSAGTWYEFTLPPSADYVSYQPEWNAADGNIQAVDVQPINSSAELWVYWIGAPPLTLPTPCIAYKHVVRTRITTAYQFKVGNFQALNSPLNVLRYNPGAVPFTVNQLGGSIDAWRGSLYVGYQNPATWLKWGLPDRAATVLQCLGDSQADYSRRAPGGATGLFSPVFYWPIWSEGVFGDYNTWGWDGPDPNTEWGQYAYRALEATAKAWYLGRGDSAIVRPAQRITMNALRYLDGFLRDSDGMPPTNITEFAAPEARYHDPAAAALILRAALWANLAGGDRILTYGLINSCLKYLTSQYVSTGLMTGSHTAGQPAFSEGGQVYRENFGFWVAEILEALSLLVQNKVQINLPPCASAGNTRAPSSLPSIVGRFAFAGYRDGQQSLPEAYSIILYASDPGWGANAVVAGNSIDQAPKINAIITTIKAQYSPNFETNIKLILPSGEICTRSQILLHCSHLTVSGWPDKSTIIRFQPDLNTRYDVMPNGGSADGDDFDLSVMTYGDSNGGWIFPGRSAIRIAPITVHPFYASEYNGAPANRKDFYLGSVNFPWRSGIKVNQNLAYAARKGDTGIAVDSPPIGVYAGGWVLIYAANTKSFYTSTGTTNPAHHRGTPNVRTRIHRVTGVDDGAIGIWPALEFDVPRNQEADGDVAIDSGFPSSYYSLIVPLEVVRGAGLESMTIQQPMDAAPSVTGATYSFSPSMAVYNYTNMAPEYAMLGVLMRWAVDCFVRDCTIQMAGSHPIATEFAVNCTVQDNFLDGSWNKGAGGNGYLRISKAGSCLIQRNTLRNLRHLTLQWSASGNVVKQNNLTMDLNLHGGWERFNLLENNISTIPYEHRYGTPSPTDPSAGSNWFPLWWGSGAHAGKWSSSSGEANIVYNNTFQKQVAQGGPMVSYLYSEAGRMYVFGIPNTPKMVPNWTHLAQDSVKIPTWGQRETIDFSQPPNSGINNLSKWDGSLHDYAKTIAPTRPQLIAYPGVENFDIFSIPTRQSHLSARLSGIEQNQGLIYKISDIARQSTVSSEAPFVPTILTVGSLNVWRFDNGRLNLNPQDARSAGTWIIHFRNDINTNSQGRILSIKVGDYAFELYPQGDFTRLQWALYRRTTPTTWSYVTGVTAATGETPKGTWRTVAVSYDIATKTMSMRVFGFGERKSSFTESIVLAPDAGAWMGWRVISPSASNLYKGEIAEVIHFGRVLSQVEQWTAMDRIRYEYRTTLT
jgi:phage-related protein